MGKRRVDSDWNGFFVVFRICLVGGCRGTRDESGFRRSESFSEGRASAFGIVGGFGSRCVRDGAPVCVSFDGVDPEVDFETPLDTMLSTAATQ